MQEIHTRVRLPKEKGDVETKSESKKAGRTARFVGWVNPSLVRPCMKFQTRVKRDFIKRTPPLSDIEREVTQLLKQTSCIACVGSSNGKSFPEGSWSWVFFKEFEGRGEICRFLFACFLEFFWRGYCRILRMWKVKRFHSKSERLRWSLSFEKLLADEI